MLEQPINALQLYSPSRKQVNISKAEHSSKKKKESACMYKRFVFSVRMNSLNVKHSFHIAGCNILLGILNYTHNYIRIEIYKRFYIQNGGC